ncbi:DNA polymerase III subunit alpha [Ornithinimicrobium faecis]|uniref:DNA polymerase III subunit alpha n=1 Tax=Ornithinimicrobium faecis TaxID=2934158 RepID=UPI002119550E|nr:DNA polymerase III subunit alpha [Ornithinimicrobium sp. HY1745]
MTSSPATSSPATSSPATSEFAHLHVASSYSMRYGASTPEALVERAVELGQSTLGLTDRDGAYGAVRFVQACARAEISPVLGVDLAVSESGEASGSGSGRGFANGAAGSLGRPQDDKVQQAGIRWTGADALGGGRSTRAQPVKGGALVDDQHPRVTVLARGQAAGLEPGIGWSRLCRLITQTHLAGERGSPRTTRELLARAAAPVGDRGEQITPVAVLLGPDSDVGRALLRRRVGLARDLLRRWQQALPAGALVIEVVCHGGPEDSPASVQHAARLWSLALEAELPAVLTAAVRHATPEQARVVDILDAARRMVALDERHLDRVSTAGHLSGTGQMHAVAERVADSVGPSVRAADLLAATAGLARQCVQSPRSDLGIGEVHLPEPEVVGVTGTGHAQQVLTERVRAAVSGRYAGQPSAYVRTVHDRLDDELRVIAGLGYPTYFLTVSAVCDLIREMGVRVAARGSGAGSLVNYLLGISGVDPIRHDLLMERFCSPLRAELPDIDIDVESARRTEIYEQILERFGSDRVTCVSMMETYRVRHAIRDVAATLGLPPGEIDVIAKAFPHIRAKDARAAVRDLPELRRHGFDAPRMQTMFEMVESLDGLPRHIALHPCGVILSNTGLLDRTPVEASWLGFPMSQFDKDDVEDLGLLKLDVLGIRMQSAMAHAVAEVERVDGVQVDLDDQSQVPYDDTETFSLIKSARTLGCFQIESPGQRELIGKFGPETFGDIIIDISLFRPGPVKSDMVRPFLNARQGWAEPEYLHPSLIPYLEDTGGVVVFHEQVLQLVAETTGVTLAQADEVRRALGTPQGQAEVESWWRPAAAARGYAPQDVDAIWDVLAAFASFGFCKAHAAAFAVPTFHSAWLKTHHTAAFLAGVLTHDPGMYPKRLILEEARAMGVHVLGLDVNASGETYRVERVEPDWDEAAGRPARAGRGDTVDEHLAQVEERAGGYGIRLSLAEVKGISEGEVARVIAGQPYHSLGDLWQRARVSRPVVERLVLAGGFDQLHGVGTARSSTLRQGPTRRDLLLHVAELERWSAPTVSRSRARARKVAPTLPAAASVAGEVADRTSAQAKGRRTWHPRQADPTQLTLDLGDEPVLLSGSGLPEMTPQEQMLAELEVLGMDVSSHVTTTFQPMLTALGVIPANQLLGQRNSTEVLVAGAKVATQTPPIRSGRRVVFLTLEDGTGPSDATFFEDVQGPFAETVFHSFLMVVRGVTRRTGPRGISLRATGAWEMTALGRAYDTGGIDAVRELMDSVEHDAVAGAREQESRARRADQQQGRRVLLHASGFKQSPYADTKPAGPGSKLWHSSPGSAGW